LPKADIAELVRWYLQFNWISQIAFGDIEENIDIAVVIGNIEIENYCRSLPTSTLLCQRPQQITPFLFDYHWNVIDTKCQACQDDQ